MRVQGDKLQYGHLALYSRGDNENARQFSSLHAVQRHMVDTNQCKMAFDDNEEEYEDYYDWSALEAEHAEGTEVPDAAGAYPSLLMLHAPEGFRLIRCCRIASGLCCRQGLRMLEPQARRWCWWMMHPRRPHWARAGMS